MLDLLPAGYMLTMPPHFPSPPPPSQPVVVANFRKSWEELNPESERADDYGLGQREGLQVCSGGGGEGLRAGAAGGAAGVSG